MATPLLATKLYIPPVPYHLIHRSELIRGLEEGLRLGRRMTVISAAPGYGKTSLVADWIYHHQHGGDTHFCWLSIEESDNDPAQFWTYFLSALQTGQPGLAESLASSIWAQPNPAIIKTFLIGLVNELAALEVRLVMVLDDFHLIENEAILNELTFLIEHLPSQLHMVLVTRAVPPLPLARWRSRNQITELGQAELHFTLSEAKTFLKAQIAAISDKEIEGIHQQLEGWPAGLQLIAIRPKAQEDPVFPMSIDPAASTLRSPRLIPYLSQAQTYLIDYLTEEVLNQLPEAVQSFLLRSSILEQFCPSLCEAVFEKSADTQQDYQSLLSQLVKQNLFLVPLDPERKWFRYQRLFRDLLQNRLAAQVSKQEMQALHHRASTWFHEHGFVAEAVHHALFGNDPDHALDWGEKYAPDFLYNSRFNALLALMREFSPADLDRRPLLSLYQARALMHTGQYASAWEHIHSLESHILAADNRSPLAELASLKALLATFTRPPDEAVRYAREALAVLPPEALVSRAQMHMLLGALHRLDASLSEAAAEILEAQRLAKQANQPYLEDRILESLAALRMQAGDYPGAENILRRTVLSGLGPGFGQVCLAVILLEWDRLAEADGYLADGLRMGEKSGVVDVLMNGYLCLSLLRCAQGDREAAVEAFNLANELSLSSPGSIWSPQVAIERRWLALKLRDAPDLALRINPGENHPSPDMPQPKYLRFGDQLVTIRALIASAQWKEAFSLAQSLEQECAACGLNRLLVEAILFKATLYENMGLAHQANQEMVRAFRKASPDGFIRVFVDEGPAVQHLLERCFPLVTPEEAAALRQLLSHFPSQPPDQGEPAPPPRPSTSALVEPLTAREKEVLSLIAAGCTNREIADRLVTTENTIKKHTSHIFEKLMVTNRTQALVKARELGLIA